jgi:hypothetical protein
MAAEDFHDLWHVIKRLEEKILDLTRELREREANRDQDLYEIRIDIERLKHARVGK